MEQNIAAIVADGTLDQKTYTDMFQACRQEADGLIVLSTGTFLRSGLPSVKSREERSRCFLQAGADMVIEIPAYGVLIRRGLYEFALTVLLQKIGCVTQLVLPCQPDTDAMRAEVADYIFRAPQEYQWRMKSFRENGKNVDTSIPSIVGRSIPGAKEFLLREDNRFAVGMQNALRLSYNPVKPMFLPFDSSQKIKPDAGNMADQKLAAQCRTLFENSSDNTLMDIFGGTPGMLSLFQGLHPETWSVGFERVTEIMASELIPSEILRYYLLRALTGFRKVDHSMYALYGYVPYMKVLASDSEWMKRLILEQAWTTVLGDGFGDLSDLDESKRELYQTEHMLDLLVE